MKNISIFGAGRSGTTFIKKIFLIICEQKPYFSHSYNKNNNVIVTRNFLDRALSEYRIRNDRENNFIIKTEKELEKIYSDHLICFNECQKCINDNKDDNLYLYYNWDIYDNKNKNNYEKIFNKISNFMEINLSETIKQKIIDETNWDKHLKISKKLKKFSVYDTNSRIHGNHLNTGGVDLFKNHICKSLCEHNVIIDINNHTEIWELFLKEKSKI